MPLPRGVEEPDRSVQRCRAQVRVPLRCSQILMTGQFLDGSRRRAAHREV